MTFTKFYSPIFLFLLLSCQGYLMAKDAEQGLDINADKVWTNLNTEVSRLEGNVELKHDQLHIRGDAAEVHAATGNQPQRFIVSGSTVNFSQTSTDTRIEASAGQIVYTPSAETLRLQENVDLLHRTGESYFEIQAVELQMVFKAEQADKLDATGAPLSFKHQLKQRMIRIEAENVDWEAATHIAILQQAVVYDNETTFSADEIRYNTLTGEISASGEGETRPSYRYTPVKEKETEKNNDT